jgi:hypothetical protein
MAQHGKANLYQPGRKRPAKIGGLLYGIGLLKQSAVFRRYGKMYGLERQHFRDAPDTRKVRHLYQQTYCRHQIGGSRAFLPVGGQCGGRGNGIMSAGLAAGGTEPTEMRDYGFMQQRTIEDFDGHTWEVFYMDVSKFPAGQPAEAQTAS